jgi:hypothetical protein
MSEWQKEKNRRFWEKWWRTGLVSCLFAATVLLIGIVTLSPIAHEEGKSFVPVVARIGLAVSFLVTVCSLTIYLHRTAIQTIRNVGSDVITPTGYTRVVNELIAPSIDSCRKAYEDCPPAECLAISVKISKPEQGLVEPKDDLEWRTISMKQSWDVRLLPARNGAPRNWSAAEFLPLIIVGSDSLVGQDLLPLVTAAKGVPYMPFLADDFKNLPNKEDYRKLAYLKDSVLPPPQTTLRIEIKHDSEDASKYVLLKRVDSSPNDMNRKPLRAVFGQLDDELRAKLCSAAFCFYIPDQDVIYPSQERPVTCILDWQYTWPVSIPQAERPRPGRYQNYLIPFLNLTTIKQLEHAVDIDNASNFTPIFSLAEKPLPHEVTKDGGWLWEWPAYKGSPALPGHSITLRWDENLPSPGV